MLDVHSISEHHLGMGRGLWILALALVLSGCHAPLQPETETIQTFSEAGDAGFERAWLAAQEVLRRDGFSLDRLDRRAGVIATFPETSQHFFEFWRKDVDTPYDFAEASLRTVRRWVEVSINPARQREVSEGEAPPPEAEAPAAPTLTMTVTVHKEHLASPERQFNNTASVLRAFGSDLPGVQGEIRIRPQDEYWIDAGRDEAMENWLIERITRRVER
ncbi:MAG TPA: hypothetical protein VGM03_08370 [Phycisphaerae bacterium]